MHPQCLRSGFCCKQAPCWYGTADPTTKWCVHLVADPPDGGPTRYRCGIYEEIKRQPGWDVNPAFGAGCSSSVLNEDRDAIRLHLAKSHRR